MQQDGEQVSPQENDAPATNIQGTVLTGPVDDAPVEPPVDGAPVDELPDTDIQGTVLTGPVYAPIDELPDTVEAVDGAADEPVTVTRTTIITNTSDGSVIKEASASHPSNLVESKAEEDKFIEELLASDWKPRGRPDGLSATDPKKKPQEPRKTAKEAPTPTMPKSKAKEAPTSSTKSKANETPPPQAKKTELKKKS